MTNTVNPGQVIDLYDVSGEGKPNLVVKTEPLNVMRLVLSAGKTIPEHKAAKHITVQCIKGKVAFSTSSNTIEMTPGKLLYLLPGELHSLSAIEDSIMLVTKAN